MQKGVFLIILLILSIISIQLAYSNDKLLVKEAIKNPFSFIISLININSISGNSLIEITGNVPFDPAITIFVDNSLSVDCIGQYNPEKIVGSRCDGSDVFDAYNTLQEAANVVLPGDEVLVRGGTYTFSTGIYGINMRRGGTATDRVTYKPYNTEQVILDFITRSGGINMVDGANYVTIEGLTMKNARDVNLRVNGVNNVIISNNKVYNDNPYFDNALGRVIGGSGIVITQNGATGPKADNALVEGNIVYNVPGGIGVDNSDNPTIRYNHVFDVGIECDEAITGCSQVHNNAHCITVSRGSYYGKIEKNVVHSCDDGGIVDREGDGRIIRDNLVYMMDMMDTAGGGYGIKTYPQELADVAAHPPSNRDLVSGNIAFDAASFPFIINSINYGPEVYNNIGLISRNGDGFTSMGRSTTDLNKNSYIKNNAAFNNFAKDIDYTGIDNEFDYNYIEDLATGYTGNSHSINGTAYPPETQFNNLIVLSIDNNEDGTPDVFDILNNRTSFVNGKDAYDYALQQARKIFGLKSTSVLIDAGTIIPGYHCPNPGPDSSGCREWYGSAPDIGAFEYIEQCTDGQTRLCSLQLGVCSGAIETCTNNIWPGCSSINYGSNYEIIESSCSDSLDNDCDGLVDLSDNSCLTTTTTTFTTTTSVLTSTTTAFTTSTTAFTSTTTLPITTTTSSSSTSSTTIAILPQCNDGYDNDNDNFIDYPADVGCDSFNDNDETDLPGTTTTTSSSTSSTTFEPVVTTTTSTTSTTTATQQSTGTGSSGGSGGGRKLTIEACTEDWVCFNWLSCEPNTGTDKSLGSYIQQRECVDRNNCGTSLLKPVTERDCVPEETRLKPPVKQEEVMGEEIKPAQFKQEEKITTAQIMINKLRELGKSKQGLIISISITLALSYLVYSVVIHRRWIRFKK